MLKVADLCKAYLDGGVRKPVLQKLNLHLQPGESLAITGDSGCGKSTLLHLLGALDQADSGSISLDGQHIDQRNEAQSAEYRRTQVGIVFQRFNLIDCFNVWDNLCFPAQLAGKLDSDYLHDLLERLGIANKKLQKPQTLSGGEQQRVAIARALAHQPKLILADEPTGNLDSNNSAKVANMLYSLCEQTLTSLVVVTHSQAIAEQAQQHKKLIDGQLQHV